MLLYNDFTLQEPAEEDDNEEEQADLTICIMKHIY